MQCEVVVAETVQGQAQTVCLAAMLVWGSPGIVVMFSFVFAAVMRILSMQRRGTDQQGMYLRMFLSCVILLVVGLWVAANVSGAGVRMSNTVISFASVAFVLMGAVVWKTTGSYTFRKQMASNPLWIRVRQSAQSDWLKAMMVLSASPLVLVVIFVSALNQLARRKVRFAKLVPAEEDGQTFWLTLAVRTQLKLVRAWNWVSVLVKANWICLFVVIINVGIGKVVTVGLSLLDTFLEAEGLELFATTGIFVGIGLTMFLLPPVPGVPVYLAGGIILTRAAEREGYSFELAVGYCCLVCWGIKLLAIVCQQKGIGEHFSSNLWVRRTVGVNSTAIHAIELILREPGITFGKVCILCGGPDWPTSVLTGILRLNLASMLCG